MSQPFLHASPWQILKEQMCFHEEMEQGFPITLEIGAQWLAN